MPQNRVTIVRPATVSDVPRLLALVAQYWGFEGISGFHNAHVTKQIGRLLSTPSLGAGWIAEADGLAVGYLLAVYVFSLEHLGLTAEIDELFVLPVRRGQGVGAQLLRAAEAEFARRGCTNVALQLSRANQAAREFYLRHSYRDRSGYELLDKNLPGPG